MPPITSFAATLTADVLWDSGILYINDTAPFGASVGGGFKFDPGTEWQNIAAGVDGVLYPVMGFDRKVGGVPRLTGTIVSLTTGMTAELEPGSTSAVVTTTTTVTPHPAGDLLDTADYLSDVRAVWRKGDGTFFCVKFPLGLLVKYDISGADKDKGAIAIEIEARQAAADVATAVAPYVLLFGAANTIGES